MSVVLPTRWLPENAIRTGRESTYSQRPRDRDALRLARTREGEADRLAAGFATRALAAGVAGTVFAARPAPSCATAARTSSACPSTLTLRKAFATRPSGEMTKVLRMTPVTFLPYIVFSPNAPNALCTDRSGSDRRQKERSCSSRNVQWLAIESFEMPTISAPRRAKSAVACENAIASRVQPGVRSRG